MNHLLALSGHGTGTAGTSVSGPELLLQLVIGLGVVLGIIAITARMLRRSGRHSSPGARRRDGAIRVVGRQSLGKGVSVALVQVGERAYLLGVTPTTIRPLGETDKDCLSVSDPALSRGSGHGGEPNDLFTWGKVGTSTALSATTSHKLPAASRSESTWTSAIDHLRELTLRRG